MKLNNTHLERDFFRSIQTPLDRITLKEYSIEITHCKHPLYKTTYSYEDKVKCMQDYLILKAFLITYQ
jgi:hypothetical protein